MNITYRGGNASHRTWPSYSVPRKCYYFEKGTRYHTNYTRDNRFGCGIQVIKIIS